MSPSLEIISSFAIVSAVFVFFQFALVHSLAKKLYYGPNKPKIKKLHLAGRAMHGSAFLSILLLTVAGMIVSIRGLSQFLLHDNKLAIKDHIYTVLSFIFYVCYASSYICCYFFLVFRLYNTFKSSLYEISNYVISIHIIVGICTILAGFTCIILQHFELVDTAQFGIKLVFMTRIIYVSIASILLLAFVHILYAFNHRLYQLVFLQRQSLTGRVSLSLTQPQLNLLVVIRKQTLLGVLMALFGLFGIVAYGLAVLVTHGKYNIFAPYLLKTKYWECIIFDVIIVMSLNIGTLCIYLGFQVNQKPYKFCCKLCDRRCKKACDSVATVKLNKKHGLDVDYDVVDMDDESDMSD